MAKRFTTGLMALAIVAGCASQPASRAARSGAVTHVVLCWLKHSGDERERQTLIDRSREFSRIPGVVAVTAGRAVPSDRPVVDDSFDVAVVITFRDRAAMEAYETHPLHQKAVAEVLKPLAGRVVIYDFEDVRE